jgi:hypothetical protein
MADCFPVTLLHAANAIHFDAHRAARLLHTIDAGRRHASSRVASATSSDDFQV